ncbi:hypothetical protein HanPI659440_Chr17g0667421 [Helianthus annuus]|nr:hypothetical protein HanPI659440_Chr17g0667421 [Helianthus annuus]
MSSRRLAIKNDWKEGRLRPPYAAAWVLLSDGERGHVEMEARDRDWNVDDDDVVVVRRRRTIAGVAGVAGGS